MPHLEGGNTKTGIPEVMYIPSIESGGTPWWSDSRIYSGWQQFPSTDRSFPSSTSARDDKDWVWDLLHVPYHWVTEPLQKHRQLAVLLPSPCFSDLAKIREVPELPPPETACKSSHRARSVLDARKNIGRKKNQISCIFLSSHPPSCYTWNCSEIP